jgi:hypothetical protein
MMTNAIALQMENATVVQMEMRHAAVERALLNRLKDIADASNSVDQGQDSLNVDFAA